MSDVSVSGDGFDLGFLDVEGVDAEVEFLLSADSVDASSAGYVPSSPYWEVSRDFFLRVLKVIATLPSRSTVFLALWLDKGSKSLVVHANNKDAVVECLIPMLCQGPYETDRVYFLDFGILARFVASYKRFFFSFDEQGGIYFETPYSRYGLEAYNLDFGQAGVRLDYSGLEWKPFLLSKRDVGVFRQLFNIAVSMQDNKMMVTPDSAFANFTLFQYSVNGKTGAGEELVVRKIDVPTLAEVCDGDVECALAEDRSYFRFPLGVVSFMRLDSSSSPSVFVDMSAEMPLQSFQVDVGLLKKALGLSKLLNAAVGEFSSDGDAVVLRAGDRAKFTVGKGGDIEPFSLSVDMLAKVAGTIPAGETFMSFSVYDGWVSLSSGGLSPCCYLVSKTTVGQMARQAKVEERQGLRESRQASLAGRGVRVANEADRIGDDGIDGILADL